MINVFKSKKGKDIVWKSYNELLTFWGTEYDEQDIQTTFGQTHCIITGEKEKPPLLLLHGVGDNSAVMWALNIKELSKYFYCIAVDTLGGPGKSIPNEKFLKKTFTQQVWLDEIVDYYKLEDFSIAGVSNGAVMAFNYATKKSRKVRKVICMEGGMVISPFKAIFTTLGMMFPEILIPTRNNMKKIMKKLISPNSDTFEKYPQIIDHLVLLMKNHNQKAMFVHNIEKYKKETAINIKDIFYFLIGEHKVETKKEFIDILIEGKFKYKIINDAGHGINHEQPEIINNQIISFILQ